jgi:hypothetical protein
VARFRAPLCGALAVATACALAAAPAAFGDAAPHLYWIDPLTHSVDASNLDGTGPTQQIAQAVTPSAVAVSGQYVYWTDDGTNSIGRANLDGSNADPTFITGADEPAGIAVNNQHIYWDNWFAGTIGEADVSGQNVNQNFIQVGGDLVQLAVDGRYLYWANNDPYASDPADPPGIGRARLDGSDVQPNFITATLQGFPSNIQGVAVDDQHVYWTDCCGNIGVADLDGTQVNTQLTRDISPGQLALDSYVLFDASPFRFPNPGWVDSFNLDGSNLTEVADVGDGGPSALAVSVPVAQVSPASPPAFGSRTVGSLSSPQILTLSNAGENELDVHGLTFSGADPGDFVVSGNTCRGDIEPGGSCQVLVSFAPQGTGSRSATLDIASTDYANSPTQIPLSGTGASSQFGPTSASISCTTSGVLTKTSTCTVTYTYGASSSASAGAARVEAVATMHGRRRVVGTGKIRHHRMTLHFRHLRRGRYRLTLLRMRPHHRPQVIGHTTLYVR